MNIGVEKCKRLLSWQHVTASRTVFAAIYSFLLCATATTGSEEKPGKPYNWTIDLETEPVQGYLNFAGSRLNSPVRVRVYYYKGAEAESEDRIHFEDLYYQDSQIIGCRRAHPLGLKPGEPIAIRVKHKKTATAGETRAASDAIVRIVVDAYAGQNLTNAVFVPDDTFNDIIRGMSRLNFVPAKATQSEKQVHTMVLNIYTDSGNQQIMRYIAPAAGKPATSP